MPTINQIVRKEREKIIDKVKTPALKANPQKEACAQRSEPRLEKTEFGVAQNCQSTLGKRDGSNCLYSRNRS